MENFLNDDEGGYAEDIFATIDYEAPKPRKKEFLPWHKPRKQFVRRYQWYEQIDKLLTCMSPDNATLTYFGLPGIDLLDLRYFHTQVCEPKQLRMRFLGFNSGANPKSPAQTELNISLHEVLKLSMIDPLSEVVHDNFCLIANEGSKAFFKTQRFAPYDIINLDLCNGIGAHEPGVLDITYYDAICHLLALQRANKKSWLLFLTTKAGKQDIHTKILQKFLEKYAQNLSECEPFKNASTETFAISDEAGVNAAATTPDGHLAVFLAGLCNWVLGLAVQSPPSKMELKSVIGYRVAAESEHDDLISLALKFEPIHVPAADPMGLANPSAASLDECDLSAKTLKRLGKRKCADDILAGNPHLYAEMVAATAALLSLARYDVGEFHTWLQTS